MHKNDERENERKHRIKNSGGTRTMSLVVVSLDLIKLNVTYRYMLSYVHYNYTDTMRQENVRA